MLLVLEQQSDGLKDMAALSCWLTMFACIGKDDHDNNTSDNVSDVIVKFV